VRLGDLIAWGGRLWIVRKLENGTRTAIIHDGRTSETIPNDAEVQQPEACQVIANPPDDWPFVAIKQRPELGRLLRITQPSLMGDEATLTVFHDWAVVDLLQPTAVFFNPALGLRHGNYLLACYEKGTCRLQIPREFLSTQGRKARSKASEAAPRLTNYERLRLNPFADADENDDEG
jgi:hypothetical protein